MNIRNLKGHEHIVIVGAGISGLSLGWFLKQKYGSKVKISIFDLENRVGGWIETDRSQGFLFEKGPRSFRTAGTGASTLRLIRSLNLEDQIIFPDKAAYKRFVYWNGHLERVSLSPFSELGRRALWALLKEPFVPKGKQEDESIGSFFQRRTGPFIKNTLIDAMVTGVFAGNIDQLSIRSCFPAMWNWEQEQGSLVMGMLKGGRKKETDPWIKKMQSQPLFSLRKGTQQLTQVLQERLKDHLWLNAPVSSIRPEGDKLVVTTPQVSFAADYVISTVQAQALIPAIQSPYLDNLLRCIPYTTVAVVNLGYKRNITEFEGFGYLIPTCEKENVLGVVFDSCVFPQQNQHTKETRLTVMIGGAHRSDLFHLDDDQYVKFAIAALRKQMNILYIPDAVSVKVAHHAIPQYQVGHPTLLKEIENSIEAYSPHLKVIGSSFYGVSVNDCIAYAEKWVQ